MSIDRIGKGPGGVSGPGGVTGTGAAEGAQKAFSVDGPGAAEGAQKAEGVEGVDASPLAQLQRGEIDVEQYMDKKVDLAVKGLAGLAESELASIRATLRDQLAEDPGLAELVRTAAGKSPGQREE